MKKILEYDYKDNLQVYFADYEGNGSYVVFHIKAGRESTAAILTMVEVLDVLPQNYKGRDEILQLFQEHVRGLAALQSGEGFWHQLLDRCYRDW